MFATMRRLATAAGVLTAAIAVSAGAYAAEITETSFGVAGGFTVPSGDTLGNTDSVIITNGGMVTVVSPDTHDLSALVTLGETGTMQSFTDLDGFTATANELTLASGVSLDLNTLSVVTQSNGYLNLSGDGVLHAPGFDPTPGLFSFTGTTTDNLTFSFAVETSAQTGVPEPMTLTLLGLGLAGLGYRRRLTA
jgi:hypothetical protein